MSAFLAARLGAGNLDKLFLDDQAALTAGAVVAAGSEAGSAWYNPAGLSKVERSEVKLGASAYAARFFEVPKFLQVGLPDGNGSMPLKTRSFFSTPSSLVYASRFGRSLGAAFSIFTRDQLDLLEVNSQDFKGKAANGDDYVAEVGSELDIRSKDYLAGPALGWQALPWLSLGGALYGGYTRIGYARTYWSDYYHPSSLFSTNMYSMRILFREDWRTSVSQISLRGNAGLQAELPGGLKLGMAVHSPQFRIYQEISQEVILDGAATTAMAGTASGIVIQYHIKGEGALHPYSWNPSEPYRGFLALGKAFSRGYVSAEADFSDLVAENGRGSLWNYRVGGIYALNERWSLGGGAYTDLADPKADLRNFGAVKVDYYGATLGLRHISRLEARSEGEKETRPLHLTTTFSVHYMRGYGEFAGQRTHVTDIQRFPFPNGGTEFLNEEISAHLGGGFVF